MKYQKIKVLVVVLSFLSLKLGFSQQWIADGIGYQAMLTEQIRETYGATIKNVPVVMKDIVVKFRITQGSSSTNVVFEEDHQLKTNEYGIFSCIIGEGVNVVGSELSKLNWGADSVIVSVLINSGSGLELFSRQKLWSTSYAFHAKTADKISGKNDTSDVNELQYINLIGDSIKLTGVNGGISIKPLNDQIKQNSNNIATLQTGLSNLDTVVKNVKTNLNTVNGQIITINQNVQRIADSLLTHRSELNSIGTKLNSLNVDINSSKSDILLLNGEIQSSKDSIAAHRAEINNNNGKVNTLTADVTTAKTDIVTLKSDAQKAKDSLSVHRAQISSNTGKIHVLTADVTTAKTDIATLKGDAQKAKDSLSVHRAEINAIKSSILPPDNLGNHTATQNLNLNNKSIHSVLKMGIGTGTIDTSAVLELNSTTGTFIPPRMTKAQRDAVVSKKPGSVVYNSTDNKLQVFVDSVNGDYKCIGGTNLYDGPYHAQAFTPAQSGKLLSFEVELVARNFYKTAIAECSVYKGNPSSMTLIGSADNTVKVTNYAGSTFGPATTSVFTFNGLNTNFSAATEYTFLVFAKDSATGGVVKIFITTSTSGGPSNGLYYRGTAFPGLNAPSPSYDLKGKILLKYASPGWQDLNQTITTPSVDMDLNFNATTNELTVTKPTTTGNKVDLSSLKGAGKLDDLSDVMYNTTNFTGSLLLGHQTTGVLSGANYNTGIGQLSLSSMKRSTNQLAIGYSALSWDTGGTASIALGYNALRLHQKSNYQIAIGRMAMGNTTGYNSSTTFYSSSNIAIGDYAMSDLLGGKNLNIAIGTSALQYHQGAGSIGIGWLTGFTSGTHFTGDYVTMVGSQAGYLTPTSGSNNTYLGYQAKPSSSTVSNEIVLGNTSISSLRCQVSLTTVSDARVKDNVQENVKGLDFIMKLKPVTYTYNRMAENKLISGDNFVDTADWTGKNDIEKIRFSGFLAQEVEKAAKSVGYEFSGVDKPQDGKSLMGLRYSEFVVPLVKAMQEQQNEIEIHKSKINQLEELIQKQNAINLELLKRLEKLESNK